MNVTSRTSDAPFAQRMLRRLSERCTVAQSLTIAIVVTLVVNAVLILNTAVYAVDDDFTIAMILSGGYSVPSQCLYTNALLNDAIIGLFQMIPDFNWFLIVERLCSFFAYFAMAYALLRYCPVLIALAISFFTALFIMPHCTVASNFTVVSAMCLFSAILLLALYVARGKKTTLLCCLLFFILGFMWRRNVFLLSLPFAFFAVCMVLLAKGKFAGGMLKRIAFVVFLGAALIGASALYNQMIWDDPDLANWERYSEARAVLVDYPTKPYAEIAGELEDIGVSERDYLCAVNLLTVDTDFFTVEKMEAIAQIGGGGNSESLLESALSEISALLVDKKFFVLVLLAIGLSIALLLRSGLRALWIPFLFLVAFAVCTVLLYVGRLPDRVEYPVWLFSLAPMLALLFSDIQQAGAHCVDGALRFFRQCVSALLCCGVVLACGFLFFEKWGPTFDFQELRQFERGVECPQEHEIAQRFASPDAVYIWDPLAYGYLEGSLKNRYLPAEGTIDNFVFIGGWTQGSQVQRLRNERLGIDNPLRALAYRPETYLVVSDLGKAAVIQDIINERYGIQMSFETEDAQSPYVVRFAQDAEN